MEQGEKRAKELGVLFIETSAKTGHNVKQVSQSLICSYCIVKMISNILHIKLCISTRKMVGVGISFESTLFVSSSTIP